jgi:hypothetical protein
LPEIGAAGIEMKVIVKLAGMREDLEQINNNSNTHHTGKGFCITGD